MLHENTIIFLYEVAMEKYVDERIKSDCTFTRGYSAGVYNTYCLFMEDIFTKEEYKEIQQRAIWKIAKKLNISDLSIIYDIIK